MKKILSLMFIVLAVVISVNADPMSDARRREREARNGYPGGGHLIPGPGPHRPHPPMPPPPRYDDVYGPAYTARWQDMGEYRAQKFLSVNYNIDVHGQFVNELLLTAQSNHIKIASAQARLANGQMVSLHHLSGMISKGQQLRLRIDNYYSLKIDQIMLTLESPNLIGSSAKLQLQLGLAY